MSVEKYKFISPGIFVSEIDNTGRAAIPEDVGPVIIGRTEKGPILEPTRINSYFEFVNVFGEPIPGGRGGDVVRNGNYTSPTYGAYGAQAWFRNNAPVTFVRLGGKAADDAETSAGLAGWQTTDTTPHSATVNNGGAFGLFIADPPTQTMLTASLEIEANTLGNGARLSIQAMDSGVEYVFNSGSENSTTAATTMTFDATGSDDAVANKNNIASNLATVINLSEAPVTASVVSSTIIALTASSATPTLSEGIDLCIYSGSATGGAPDAGPEDWLLEIDGTAQLNTFSGTLSASYAQTTGTLAAAWYIDQQATIGLSGTRCDTGETGAGAGIYFDSVGNREFKVQISASGTPNGVLIDSAFNFTDTSDQFIRKTFNTNPILTNSEVVDNTSNAFTRYWLGESYGGAVSDTVSSTGNQIGVILPLLSGSALEGGDFRKDYQNAETGYFFSQDLATGESATGSFDVSAGTTNLFKLVAKNSGDFVSRNLKVSISDIRASDDPTGDQPYGTFSILIRKMSDTDNRIEVIEEFNNCNLNPSSENFIGKKIGDKYQEWSVEEKRYKTYGNYDGRSRYIYASIPEEVKLGETDARFLPFGVRGPIQFQSFQDLTSSQLGTPTLVSGNFNNMGNPAVTTFISGAQVTNGLVRFEFPQLRLRVSASEGNPVDPLNSFYGVDPTFNSSRLNNSVKDHLKVLPGSLSNFNAAGAGSGGTEISFNFTLDDMCYATGSTANIKFYAYKAGSRADDSARGGLEYLRGTSAYTEVLDAGVDRFTTVFAGGYDGLDVKESEPMRTINYPSSGNPSTTNNAVFNSLDMAIDSIRDPEVVEYNVAAMPGVVNATLNTKLVDMCESRGDALAIVDVKGGFIPPEQSTLAASSRRGSVQNVVTELKTNPMNSSYGAAYYPYVQIKDLNNGQTVTVPPSVAAIGALSYSQKVSELWFAPAGFTRGGISSGRAGLPVVGVKDRLQSRDRDKLYENRINPIAQFPAEGIVIFGQKTLQIQGSALDRINVRRLMIFLKRQISRFAATILFDQNVRVTWNRFRGRVEPFLRGVQAGLGITDFKMVLDETTTTPDLIDRNILYAKIYIKPARAIEFIAVDFILTDTGAAFED
jgi:hypothetical protein